MKKESGFSLMELMIIIAIVGNLAALAIPFYNRLIARAKITEAISYGFTAKRAVLTHRMATGSWPDDFRDVVSTSYNSANLMGSHVTGMWGGSVDVAGTSIYFINLWLDPGQVHPEDGIDFVIVSFVFENESDGMCGPVNPSHYQYFPSSCRTYYSDYVASL